jgi:2,4-dienoyl-CoA reductase (NADPH2)
VVVLGDRDLPARDRPARDQPAHDPDISRLVLELQHHPTGTDQQLECDWAACAIPVEPEDSLWRGLAAAPFEVHRVGDCLAPRRAHAAVIEGERVGAAL